MDGIHHYVGLGEMPKSPIVNYLARSLSAFYAMLGAFTLFISFDINRYRNLVTLWAGPAIHVVATRRLQKRAVRAAFASATTSTGAGKQFSRLMLFGPPRPCVAGVFFAADG